MMTFRHWHVLDADPPSRRIPSRVSSLSSLEPLSQFNGWSRFHLSSKARLFFSIIGVFAGAYACSSSALAEVEEDTNQEVNKHIYSIPMSYNDIMTNLLIHNYTDEDLAIYLSTLDSSHSGADLIYRDAETNNSGHIAFSSSTKSHGIDDPFIPETVWSFDASTGAHLDNISGRPGSDIYAVFEGSPELNDFFVRAVFASSADNNTDIAGSLFPPPKFQVASCGGNSAEHSDLDYCNNLNLITDKLNDTSPQSKQIANNTATQAPGENLLSSSDGQAPDLSAQPNTAPFIPTSVDNSLLPATLSVLGACPVSLSCASVLIDPLKRPAHGSALDAPPLDAPPLDAPPLDAPPLDAPPLDPPPLVAGLAPSLDLPYPETPAASPISPVDNPESISDLPPLFTPQPLNPIPEASTWVMIIIGFSIMAFAFRKKRRPSINPISIIDAADTD
jgi:hypothetical protein